MRNKREINGLLKLAIYYSKRSLSRGIRVTARANTSRPNARSETLRKRRGRDSHARDVPHVTVYLAVGTEVIA